MNLHEPSLYIEMVGPSGVGKTSLVEAIYNEIPKYCVSIRGGVTKRRIQNIINTFTSKKRMRQFIRQYYYLRNAKGVSRRNACWRAAAMAGMSVCYRLTHRKPFAVLVEEGPVSYLASCGQYTDRWQEWIDVLLPAPASVRPVYVMLTASNEELCRRAIKRGRQPQRRTSPKGTEDVSAKVRADARKYWMARLSEQDAFCVVIDTEGKSADAVGQILLKFLKSNNLIDPYSGYKESN